MTDHPRDEFDAVPETSARQGVHREKPIPARSGGLGLQITVGILALLVGLGAYFVLPRLGLTGSADSPAAASASVSGNATGAAEPSESADPEATADPSGSTRSTEEADPDATSSPGAGNDAGDVDQDQTVNVLNGTGAPGLASVAAGRLASSGWTAALPGNWAGAPVDASVVFYDGEAQRAGAEAVAADLGITNIIDSSDVSPAISVVLGPDFE